MIGLSTPIKTALLSTMLLLAFSLNRVNAEETLRASTPAGLAPKTLDTVIVQTIHEVSANQPLTLDEPAAIELRIPSFDSQSNSKTIQKDEPLELTVVVSGNPEPSVSWYKDGVEIEGATEKTFRLKRAKLFDTAIYTARATNQEGVTESDPIAVIVDWDLSEMSIARIWNETLLDAIRKDFPAPTIHSRNLYHVSGAMWDAFWAYENGGWEQASAVFHKEVLDVSALGSGRPYAQSEAISYVAYRVLQQRYKDSIGQDYTLFALDWVMNALGYDKDFESVEGTSPAAVGNRIASVLITRTLEDGSNESNGYADTSGYRVSNEPLVLKFPGSNLAAPNHWQPLAFDYRQTQNGIPIGEDVQTFIGVNWRAVETFAIEKSGPNSIALDPGPPPLLNTETQDEFLNAVLEVIRFSSYLDPISNVMVDISPGARLNNRLGFNNGVGRDVNPITQTPYAENSVNLADYGRILAEFWADGPASEMPPGHWNTLHNEIVDGQTFVRKYGGVGSELSPLEWDIQAYLALNGAMHDAAVAAWTLKRQYDYVRPVSMVRYLGGRGQSSLPDDPSYDTHGLPLENGLVEIITEDSSAEGQRHAALMDYVGEIAIYAWAGEPENPDEEVGGVDWIRAVDWLPYQRDTFVTPAFAAYVSGHSTFSRAAAEVMTLLTGSPYFPGGMGAFTFHKDEYLEFEIGPSSDVTLQWATYYDAADQAGISRLYGGIHVSADDVVGRRLGARIGLEAFMKAHSLRNGAGIQRGIKDVGFSGNFDFTARGPLFSITPLDESNQPLPIVRVGESFAFEDDLSPGVYFRLYSSNSDRYDLLSKGGDFRSFVAWPEGMSASSSGVTRFRIAGEHPRMVFVRLLSEGASELVSNPVSSPSLEVYRIGDGQERVLVSSNQGWSQSERASLLEVASAKLELEELNHDSNDAGVFVVLGEGDYEIELGNASGIGSEAQLEFYLVD